MHILLNIRMHVINRKKMYGFKYYRFKSSLSSIKEDSVTKEDIALRTVKLSEILDCSKYTARELMLKNKDILSMNSENFIINATFCNKYFRLSDVVEFPVLMSLNPSILQHRYYSLRELGCSNLGASHILRFQNIMKKTPQALTEEKICLHPNEHLDFFMDILPECSISDQKDLKYRLLKMYSDGSTCWKIKETMNAEFLSFKLNCSLYKVHQMFRKYPPMRVQSALNTSHLLDLLFHQLNFSISKVTQAPQVLSLHHEIAGHFLEKTPAILGIDILEIVKKLPLILRRPTNTIHKVEQVLRKFNISDKQLLCCPKVINFSPHTLQKRLEYLCNSEEFALLKSYKKFLWLVYHYCNLSYRLEAIKALNMPISVNMFIVTKSNFEKYLSHSKCCSHLDAVSHYLAEVFKLSQKDILLKLQEFPNSHSCTLINSSQVVNFLLESGVSKKQIFHGLGIILYECNTVKEYFKEFQSYPSCQPFEDWRTHYNLIQLLIYAIEVDHGFKCSKSYEAETSYHDSDNLTRCSYAC